MNKSSLAKKASIVVLSLFAGAAIAQNSAAGREGGGATGPDADGTAQVKPKSDPTLQGSGTSTTAPEGSAATDSTHKGSKSMKDNKRKGTRGNAASRESTDGAPTGTSPTNENNTTGGTQR